MPEGDPRVLSGEGHLHQCGLSAFYCTFLLLSLPQMLWSDHLNLPWSDCPA